MRICLIIILVVLLLWNTRLYVEFPERLTVSVVDGKTYTVKKHYKNHQKASDILARLNNINKTVIEHMKDKYANTPEVDVDFWPRITTGMFCLNILLEQQ